MTPLICSVEQCLTSANVFLVQPDPGQHKAAVMRNSFQAQRQPCLTWRSLNWSPPYSSISYGKILQVPTENEPESSTALTWQTSAVFQHGVSARPFPKMPLTYEPSDAALEIRKFQLPTSFFTFSLVILRQHLGLPGSSYPQDSIWGRNLLISEISPSHRGQNPNTRANHSAVALTWAWITPIPSVLPAGDQICDSHTQGVNRYTSSSHEQQEGTKGQQASTTCSGAFLNCVPDPASPIDVNSPIQFNRAAHGNTDRKFWLCFGKLNFKNSLSIP